MIEKISYGIWLEMIWLLSNSKFVFFPLAKAPREKTYKLDKNYIQPQAIEILYQNQTIVATNIKSTPTIGNICCVVKLTFATTCVYVLLPVSKWNTRLRFKIRYTLFIFLGYKIYIFKKNPKTSQWF